MPLIAIEGLDGSGKATQTALLVKALEESGVPVRRVSFPDYDSPSSALVKMYLNGDFGATPGDVNPYAASSFYAVDRFASFRRNWETFYRSGGTVVADRYATSNAIHQCAKLPEAQWDSFLAWLFHYEYDLLGIPAPDAVIYLRLSPPVSAALLSGRYQGDESRLDIHERDRAYQSRARAAADYCCQKLGWLAVECEENGGPRRAADIHREILTRLHGASCTPEA